MTRVLFTADWQCSSGNLAKCEVMLEHLLKLIDKHKPDAVVHLGDLKEAFNPVPQQVTNFLIRATKAILEKTQFVVLLGNHDRTNTSDASESCLPVMQAAGAVEFEGPGVFKISEGVWIYLVPFMRDTQAMLKALRERPEITPTPKMLLLGFHAEIKGSRITMNTETNSDSAIPADGLWPRDYAACIGGHIHHQQKLRDNIWYVGSPFNHDWRETNHRSGFLLAVCKKSGIKITRLPSPLPGYHDPDLHGFDPKQDFTGAHVRVHALCPQGEIPDKYIREAQENGRTRFPGSIVHVVPIFDGGGSVDPNVSLSQGDEELIQKYLNASAYSDSDTKAMAAYLHYKMQRYGFSMMGLEKLTFLEATAKNALCFEDCKVDFRWKGITLVTGANKDWDGRSNGSGKSSALSLPHVALFGATPKRQKNDAWGRRGYKGTSTGRLLMQLADRRIVEIIRQRHPVGLRVLIDGQDCTMGTVGQTQAFIENLTRMSLSVANSALYIGQREVNTILTGTDKERKELLSQFLGLDRFLSVQSDIGKDRKKCNDAMERVQNEVDVLTAKIHEAREQAKRFKSSYTVAECNNHIRKFNKRSALVQSSGAALEKELKALEEEIGAQADLNEANMRVAAKFSVRLENINADLRSMEDLKSGAVCSACRQPISGKVLLKHRKEQRELKEAIEKDRARFAETTLAPAEKLRKARREKSFELRDKLEALQEEKCAIASKSSTWLQRLRNAQSLERARCEQKEATAGLKRRRSIHKQYLGQLEERLKFLENCSTVVGRDGLPAFLCASVCPALNAAAAKYSNMLSDGVIGVQFAVEEGDLDIQVVNLQGGEGVEDQSHGEMRMAGLVASFALRDVLVPYNLLILDEPGEGLDTQNARMFAAGLNEVAERFGSLFIVTHNPFILSELEPSRHLEVTKENGVSTLRRVA